MIRVPKPKKGQLPSYRLRDLAHDRRKALEKVMRRDGYSTVIKELNVLAILNKNTQPINHKKVRNDMAYLKTHRAAIESSKKVGSSPRKRKTNKKKV